MCAPARSRHAPDRYLTQQPCEGCRAQNLPYHIPASDTRALLQPMEGLMHKLSRREALRGTGVAALAAAGVAALPFVANASDDPLLGLLNRYMAEEAWFDSYHADLDERRDELGWDKVNDLLDSEIDAYHSRCEAMFRRMVGLPAQAASSIVILNLISEQIQEGESLWQEYHLELMKSVRAYIASMGVRS
jgi:hypothetical protein